MADTESFGGYDYVEQRYGVLSFVLNYLLISVILVVALGSAAALRLMLVLHRSRPVSESRTKKRPHRTTHLLIVLGSGGHTTEMFDMLCRLPKLGSEYHHRTYVVSTGDSFSALKAAEFERVLSETTETPNDRSCFTIVTVKRARKIHQPLSTTPLSASQCLWDCIKLLRGQHSDQRVGEEKKLDYPDLILTNGPGTGVCVVIASIILRFFGFCGPQSQTGRGAQGHTTSEMRTIFIESWARVKTLSLSGKILLPLVDRFLVQWPGLQIQGRKAEFVGALVA